MATPQISTKVPAPLTIEPAVTVDVHDADTFHTQLPMEALIPGVEPAGWREDVRLAHVNAAELSTAAGQTAKGSVVGWFQQHTKLKLHVWGRDKYGRLLADPEDVATGELLSAYVATLPGSAPMFVRNQLAPSYVRAYDQHVAAHG